MLQRVVKSCWSQTCDPQNRPQTPAVMPAHAAGLGNRRARKGKLCMGDGRTANWLARLVSMITAPPIMAGAAAGVVHAYSPNLFGEGPKWFMIALLFLTVIPLASYVAARIIPSIRVLGRKGQRKLAFIVSVISYVAGAIGCLSAKAPRVVSAFFLSYLAAGGILSLINSAFKFRASGHACGFSGPITIVAAIVGPVALSAFAALPLVFWSRLQMQRHSKAQLWSGTAVGIAATAAVIKAFL